MLNGMSEGIEDLMKLNVGGRVRLRRERTAKGGQGTGMLAAGGGGGGCAMWERLVRISSSKSGDGNGDGHLVLERECRALGSELFLLTKM